VILLLFQKTDEHRLALPIGPFCLREDDFERLKPAGTYSASPTALSAS
jgi:hypothetical protein